MVVCKCCSETCLQQFVQPKMKTSSLIYCHVSWNVKVHVIIEHTENKLL